MDSLKEKIQFAWEHNRKALIALGIASKLVSSLIMYDLYFKDIDAKYDDSNQGVSDPIWNEQVCDTVPSNEVVYGDGEGRNVGGTTDTCETTSTQ